MRLGGLGLLQLGPRADVKVLHRRLCGDFPDSGWLGVFELDWHVAFTCWDCWGTMAMPVTLPLSGAPSQ
ncbi:hypothetical protein Q3G72_010258 [Acer saccharum]|nr:hypothetical protein Q3G72_010258 [Acer saccharum]